MKPKPRTRQQCAQAKVDANFKAERAAAAAARRLADAEKAVVAAAEAFIDSDAYEDANRLLDLSVAVRALRTAREGGVS